MPDTTPATVPAAAPAHDPIATTAHQTAIRYRQRAEYIRAVADAFAQDTPQNGTTRLIVAALVTAAEDAEGMAGTLDADDMQEVA